MNRRSGLVRHLAVPVARSVLRVAQLVTRDQRDFNAAILAAARNVAQLLARLHPLIDGQLEAARRASQELQARVVSLETQLAGLLEDRARQELDAAQARARLEALAPGEAPADGQLSGAMYLAFEDRFRGSREDIQGRVRAYLPVVAEAGAGSPGREVLDLGPGRGEWLQVLAQEGLLGRGAELDASMVAQCVGLGLQVVQADGVDHLRSLPASSLGAVTAFHVVEHLPPPRVLVLLAEAFRVLRPGGVLILETPDPRNLMVGASTFYIDPTHRNPVHPDSLAFLAAAQGFSRVQVVGLHPDEAARLPDDGAPVTALLNRLLHGPRDYALIGRRDEPEA
jgi:O-antigen chain-terminating methyltransferase